MADVVRDGNLRTGRRSDRYTDPVAQPYQDDHKDELRATQTRRYLAPKLKPDLFTYSDPHYTQLLAMVCNEECVIAQVRQSRNAFMVPSRSTVIVLFQDDKIGALGPIGYDMKSLKACTRLSDGAVFIVGDRSPSLYRSARRMAAGKRRRALLIETRPERLDAWQQVLRAAKPRLRILVGPIPPLEVDR